MADLTTVYSGFRGVDFRGEDVNLARSSDSLNMWKDYREVESVRTRPTMELRKWFGDTIYGIFFYTLGDTEMTIVHAGDNLYKVVDGEKTKIWKFVDRKRSSAFVYNNIFYFKDGTVYLYYDGTNIGAVSDYNSPTADGDMFITTKYEYIYVPTTSISRTPLGGGKTYEDVNLLTGWRKNTFCADGTSRIYYLDAQDIDEVKPIITVDGKKVTDFATNNEEGKILFTTPPPKPLTEGEDNVCIEFRKTTEGHADKINKCTLLQVFDNRVFFSGNPEYPNGIWHCSLNEPSYCSDLDYYNEGLDSTEIRGMVAGNNGLWVFKKPSQSNTSIFYHTPTTDSTYGKIYPSTHSSISTGCIGRAINFNDDIIFFSDRGMEGINGDITTEQVIAHRSTMVDSKLTAEANYENMILVEWEGYLVVIIDNKVYLADSRAMFTNENHYEYEWFYWEFDKKITSAKVNNGILWLGTEDGLYSLTGNKSIHSYWETPKNRFNNPQRTKTTNKRGSVVEAEGDISVSVKTDKTEYEHIGDFNGVKDYFVMRIKRKKFKDLQIKFESNTHFSLESATLECYVGGYIKR